MSLTAHSPTIGHKRFLSDSDSPDTSSHLAKRSRQIKKRAAKRSIPSASRESLIATLRSLFPDMDETVVVRTLKSAGSDFDEAVRLLGQLQLTQTQLKEANAAAERHAYRSGQSQQEVARPDEGSSVGAAEPSEKRDEDKSPGEWVDGLVQHMASAKDMSDARLRAANTLRSFEQTVMARARQGDINEAKSRIADLAKENIVLKRAVNIQQNRLQEAANTNKQQAEQAEAMVKELREKVHVLEMSNYSLSMHLKHATDNQSLGMRHQHPDVF